MATRSYGAGTMRERGPGRWQLSWFVTDPLTGRRVRRYETMTGAKTAATRRLAALSSTADADGTTITLQQCLDRWLEVARHELTTRANYARGAATIPAHVLATPIADIRAAHISELVRAVERAHGVHRARLVHATISGALTQAWRWEWIAHNPARRVTPPAAPERPATQPTPSQVRSLLALVAEQPQTLAWLMLAAVTGGRRSEVLGLRWSHVQLDAGQVRIEQALDPANATEKATKTRGKRVVAIGPEMVAVLQAWRTAMLERARSANVELVADPFVFSDALDGATPWRPDVGTKRFGRLRARLPELAGVRLNDLRHFVATEALAAGIDLKTVGGRLGHTRVTTTGDTYAHVQPAKDQEVAAVMERHLRAV